MTEQKEQPKKKRPIKRKFLTKFVDAGGTVRCWLDTEKGELCFRRTRVRRMSRMSLRDVYDKVIGQMALPLGQ